MRRGFAILAVLALLAAFPAAASAATFCVQGPCPSGAQTHTTLEAALTDANGNGAGVRDRIEIGAGDLPTNANDGAGNAVDIVGAGAGSTTLSGTGTTTLQMSEPTSTLSGVTVRMPNGAGTTGLLMYGTTRDVVVVNGSGTTSGTGILLINDAVLDDSRVSLPVISGYAGVLAGPGPGRTTTVEDTEITGYVGLDASGSGTTGIVNARRLVVSGSQTVRCAGGVLNISSSLVRTTGIFGRALQAATALSSELSRTINARHLTVIGDGSADSEGASASAATTGRSSTVNVRDSIVRGFTADRYRTASAGTANLSLSYSDFSTFFDQNSGTGTGSTTLGAGNVDVDPAFVDAAGGNYRLSSGSPLIDVGDPAPLGPTDSTLDLDRAARIADGNQDGTARGDMGAYERQPPAAPASGGGGGGGAAGSALPDLAPVVSSFSVTNRVFRVGRRATPLSAARRPVGTRFRFRLSEAARVAIAIERKLPGVRVRYRGKLRCLARTQRNLRRPGPRTRCTRYSARGTLRRSRRAGAGSVAFSGRMGRKALAPGSYRATIRATDSGGKRSAARRLAFRIVKR